ncbi:MAG: winged helix-turn-helix domain-containing protein [Candidatus Aenigmatarchaeota archaeon]
MSEDRITLDREAFRSLASETRIYILKSLFVRRKMLAELSKELGMTPSSVKEHMESLMKAGLVTLKDDGHKWKYYELTRKGREILRPGERRIWIILSLSMLALLFTTYDLIVGFLRSGQGFMKSAPKMVAGDYQSTLPALQQVPYFHIIGIALFAALFGIALGYYVGIKKLWQLRF